MKTFFVVIDDTLAFQIKAKNVFDGYREVLEKSTKGKIQLIEKAYFNDWSRQKIK